MSTRAQTLDSLSITALVALLRSRGFQEDAIRVIEDEQIDGEALLALEAEDIKSLFPKVGPRTKLMKLIKENSTVIPTQQQETAVSSRTQQQTPDGSVFAQTITKVTEELQQVKSMLAGISLQSAVKPTLNQGVLSLLSAPPASSSVPIVEPVLNPTSSTPAPQTTSEQPISFKIPQSYSAPTQLPVATSGPANSTTKIAAVAVGNHTQIIPVVPDPLDVNNYGPHTVTVFAENGDTPLVSSHISVTPPVNIQMPRQVVVKDPINNPVPDASVSVLNKASNAPVHSGKTDQQGVCPLPVFAAGAYTIGISGDNLQPQSFEAVSFNNMQNPGDTPHFLNRNIAVGEVEIVLRWNAKPRDLDSHLFASDGRHIYFAKKEDCNMSLDCDVRNGYGPETIKFKPEPGVKYVYAVHNYSQDALLTASGAEVRLATKSGVPLVRKIPATHQPEAKFWVVWLLHERTAIDIGTFINAKHYSDNKLMDTFFV